MSPLSTVDVDVNIDVCGSLVVLVVLVVRAVPVVGGAVDIDAVTDGGLVFPDAGDAAAPPVTGDAAAPPVTLPFVSVLVTVVVLVLFRVVVGNVVAPGGNGFAVLSWQ